jgi:hypothetical protein
MNSSILDFTSQFNLSNTPADLTLVDTTPYLANGVNPSLKQISGLFVLKTSAGIFHSNIDYFVPDIDRVVTDTFTHKLPLDVNGVVVTGDYEMTYSITIFNETISYTLIGLDKVANTVLISGNYVADILNTIGSTIMLCDGSGQISTATIDVTNVTYNKFTNITTIGIVEVLDPPLDNATYFTANSDNTYSVTKTISFDFQEPQVVIEVTDDCPTSTLLSKDNSDYTATYQGQSLSPIVVSRTHTIKYPQSISPQPSDVVTSLDTVSVSPIYTKTWTTVISTDLVYLLDTGVTVSITVQGSEDHLVECNNGLCCASLCIYNLYSSYIAALGTNPALAQTYRELLIKVMGCWMNYSIFTSCGNMNYAQKMLVQIIELVKASNCDCCNDADTMPVQVIPIIGNGTGTSTTVVVTDGTGIVVTSNTIGTTTTYQVSLDQYIVSSIVSSSIAGQELFDHADTVQLSLVNGQVIMYNSTTKKWNNVSLGLGSLTDIDLTTNVPADTYVLTWNAATGKAEFLPSVTKNILLNDIADVGTDANGAVKVLKTHTLTAGELANDGDSILIEAEHLIYNGTPSYVKYGFQVINFYFGLTPSLIQAFVPYDTYIKTECIISRVSSTQLYYELRWYSGASPSVVVTKSGMLTESSANAFVIRLSGQDTITPNVANNVICKYLRITKNNI